MPRPPRRRAAPAAPPGLSGPRAASVLLMMASLGALTVGGPAGCAAHTRVAGVVDASGGSTRLIEPSGRAWRLIPTAPDDVWLRELGGCTVHVEATALGRRLRVGRWLVTDAGDGSQPYLGVLERTGHQLRLRDRQSGAVLVLEAPLDGPLAGLDGQPVLVAGFLVGPNRLQVVSHRALAAP